MLAGALGYPTLADTNSVADACVRWNADRFGWVLKPTQIALLPEVLTSLDMMLEHFSRPGSPVVLPTPAYAPFFSILRDHGREIIEVPMLREPRGWALDYAGIERAFARGAGLLVLVNPANPAGTVFTREELALLAGIVERYGARVWADEIHASLIYEGKIHVPYASLSEATAMHTVTATSASKGWNTAGLKCAQMVLTNPDDVKTWQKSGRWVSHTTGYLGMIATIAAYNEGREWLDQLVLHLDHRRQQLSALVSEHVPLAEYVPAEGTYLAWLGLEQYGVEQKNLQTFFLREARVAVTNGRQFGRKWGGYVRLNFATPARLVEEQIVRIAQALHRI